MKRLLTKIVGAVCLLALIVPVLGATPAFAPTYANISYGPYPEDLLDVYLPPGNGPFGVVICYGAIWVSKKGVPGNGFSQWLPKGIAMAAVQTRGMNLAMKEKAPVPISYVEIDSRRALKFVQYHAKDWHIDINRIGTMGGSQSGIPSFYAALTAGKVDPHADDPVERESVKVQGIGFMRAPGSIDPKRLQSWNPSPLAQWGAPAWGCSFEESLKRYHELYPIISQWSPEYFVTKETPPIFIENNWGLTNPEDITPADYNVHSPLWGIGLKKYVEQFGVTCYQKYPGHPPAKYTDMFDFLAKRLQAVPE